MSQLIITAVGPDRPGIVGELTGHLHLAGGNIVDSRMVNLRGEFAMMILLESSETDATKLTKELPAVGTKMGLTLSITPQVQAPKVAEGLHYRLKTYSMDQPGIVARLTNLLRAHGVNIEELSAWQESAAFAGSPLFMTEMALTIPPAVALRKLRADLESLCTELNCDVDLEPQE
ncbi:MAG TPA: ACT domain-containing protein [Tepidisphaeraceae bacterium]|jgi:glycine cleavage system transcriptional repressor|nr:ACT domain-containing protein [Tepidisphaeraceae bacterium]